MNAHVLNVIIVMCLSLFSACTKTEENNQIKSSISTENGSPAFDPMGLTLNSTNLVSGRDVWIANCSVCHLEGLGGAPLIGNSKAWSWRMDKTIDTLYSHAIEGYYGDHGEMPARGGNEDLNDSQIKSAVDFMIYSSK